MNASLRPNPLRLGVNIDHVATIRNARGGVVNVGVGPEAATAVLVNRQYIRGVVQVDIRTGVRHDRLPGATLGGTNWTDRS